MLSFTRQYSDIIQVSWKTFKLLHRKFIQNSVYQILSETMGFGGRYDRRKHFGVFFWFTVYFQFSVPSRWQAFTDSDIL